MSKDKTKKKKIGWWRMVAKWVFSPLLSLGKQATKEAIPPEFQPLEELAVLSIDIAEDFVNIYTDLNSDNKTQVKEWWQEHKGEVIDTSISSILFAAQEILMKMKTTGKKYEHLSPREKQIYKIHKALED